MSYSYPTDSCDLPWQAPSAKSVADRPLLIDIDTQVSLGTVDNTGGMTGSPAVNGGAMAAGGTTVKHVVGTTCCSKCGSGTIMTQ